MARHKIDLIWWLQINGNDFLMTEWDKPSGAKGQQHYDVPAADNLRAFLGYPSGHGAVEGADLTKTVYAIGNPSQSSEIPFSLRKGGRALIKLQNLFSSNSMRPPVWSPAVSPWPKPNNPKTLSAVEADEIAAKGLLIYVVKTTEDKYFAGFTTGQTDGSLWPETVHDLLPVPGRIVGRGKVRTGLINVHKSVQKDSNYSPLAQKVIDALKRNKNVLLYGPPGTGKTHALNQVRQLLENDVSLPGIELEDSSLAAPFLSREQPAMIPTPSRVEFVTFHQDFGYEDFVIGLRPIPATSLTLQPFAGILMDCAISVSRQEQGVQSAVIMVDEMNRGNVPKILGDFLTFMDDSYRASADGNHNGAIPVRLAKVQSVDDGNGQQKSEPIRRLDGQETELTVPWYFPHHVYLLATMNSVDKSVAPLDSAIGRRFERIDAFPDLNDLADQLGISSERRDQLLRRFVTSVSAAVATPSESEDEEFSADDVGNLSDADAAQDSVDLGSSPNEDESSHTPQELALLLLKSINDFIDDTLGVDFELGHAYFWSIETENDLIAAWDTLVWPQIRDRFGARPQELLKLLRANQEGRPAKYAFALRSATSKHVIVEPLGDMETADAMATLRFLAKQ